MTDAQAVQFVHDVISGQRTLVSQEQKALSRDPNPEWFCSYGSGVIVKMHTGVRRETISGVKFTDTDPERSFFNLGMALALKGGVGPSRAVNDYGWAFAGWTSSITWADAKAFLAKLLSNSLALTPNLKKS